MEEVQDVREGGDKQVARRPLRCGWCATGHHVSCRGRCDCGCDRSMKGVYRRDGGASPAELERNPWAFRCEKPDCYYGVCAPTEDEADRQRYTHGCPRTGGPMGTGPSLLEKSWQLLDGLIDEYVNEAPAPRLAQRAHGICEVIAIFMVPYLPTANDVWAEAMARHRDRVAGNHHVTPGISF